MNQKTLLNICLGVLLFILVLLLVTVGRPRDAAGRRHFFFLKKGGIVQSNNTNMPSNNNNANVANTNENVSPTNQNTNNTATNIAHTPANANVTTGNTTNTPSGKNTNTTSGNSANQIYGVMASAGTRADGVTYAKDLGASWVRVNFKVDGKSSVTTALQYLDGGLNAVVTLTYQNSNNIDTTHGTVAEWPKAGFPYKDKALFESDIKKSIASLTPYLAKGRRIYLQYENEVSDVSYATNAAFWRGTTDQYLTSLAAFAEAVHSTNASLKVVESSFTSQALATIAHPDGSQKYKYQVDRMTKMLASTAYDFSDLHFYNCVSDIAPEVAWVKAHMPSGTGWITTENSGPTPQCSGSVSWEQDLSKFEQAEAGDVSARMQACRDNGANVCLWFSLFDLNGEVATFNHLGLVTQETSPRKKPAYDAFKQFLAAH